MRWGWIFVRLSKIKRLDGRLHILWDWKILSYYGFKCSPRHDLKKEFDSIENSIETFSSSY